jgi:hypothetical protein
MALLAGAGGPGWGQGNEPPPVTIGVRQDARPFAWQADDNAATFRGYLVDLCIDATTRAGFRFRLLPVDAAQRDRILEGRGFEAEVAPGGAREAIDLLCDPTTLTLGRLETFARDPETSHAVFSPIVFVANGSYVRHDGKENQAACKVGATDEAGAAIHPACWTRSRLGAKGEAIEEVVLPDKIACSAPRGGGAQEYFVAATVVGTTARATIERAARLDQLDLGAGQRVCTVLVRDHRAGVRSFCRNDFHFYFGDLDIIQAYRTLARQEGVDCDLARAERPLSYEPYALLLPSRSTEYRAKFIAALYEIFSDGTAASRFDAYFPDHAKSSALGLLYRINSIPGLRSAERDREAAGGGEGGDRQGEQGEPGEQQEPRPGVSGLGGGGDAARPEDQGRQVERQHQEREQQAAAADADGQRRADGAEQR